jgi:integrative and conjugative element protein (TIGR02256 family)
MPEGVLDFGERLPDQDSRNLTVVAARATAVAVAEHRDFELVELRGDAVSEMLVVECECDVFPKNPPGIHYREPLSLRFYRDPKILPEARALRPDFPVLLHENSPKPGEPIWLCVYQEPWPELRRTWTPQKFLARIQWWLKAAAAGELHPPERAPEQLFFEGYCSIILPGNFDQLAGSKEHALNLELRSTSDAGKLVATANFGPVGKYLQSGDRHYAVLALTLPAIDQTRPELTPPTLGELHDRFAAVGSPINKLLFGEIQRVAAETGLPHVMGQKTLLILTVPVRNPVGGAHRTERRGFLVDAGLGELGVMAGVLMRTGKGDRYVRAMLLGEMQLQPAWRDVGIFQLDIREAFTPEKARLYSGIAGPGPKGVLAGAGALGSALADIWVREGWGHWSSIDPDVLFPHNLARHRGYEPQVGVPKAHIVRDLRAAVYNDTDPVSALRGEANDFDNAEVVNLLKSAELIADVSTTIGVPRDLAQRDDLKRCVTAYVTPSGQDSVMLLEDKRRTIRLDCLEAQYYRFMLDAPWAETHLKGHRGDLYVGAGCRDVSVIISGEFIQLHAALLARQIRQRSAEPRAHIQVWRADPDTGEVRTTAFGITTPLYTGLPGIEIVWDEGLQAKLREMRAQGLPRESGGVLLGYMDALARRIYVVDALSPPPDSHRSREEFGRGVEGLAPRVKQVMDRTANIVGYIGEWHSHPEGVEADPSRKDAFLLIRLAEILRQDGVPALMLIVGETTETWLLAG